MSQPLVRVELFGGLRVIAAGNGPIEFSHQQTGALLAYLALHFSRSHNREELVAIFWSDDDAEDGRRKLRQSIYALRQQFEPDSEHSAELFISTRDTIGLNPKVISTDVRDFEAAVRQAALCDEPQDRLEHLLSADALYRGELLSGFYQDELLSSRSDFASRHRIALQDTVQTYEQLGDMDAAIVTARRIVAQDPLTEEAHTELMQVYASAGRPSEVRRQLKELEKVFAAELGVKPSEAAYALADRLRAEAEIAAPSANGNVAMHDPSAPHSLEKAPSRPPSHRFVTLLAITAMAIPLAIWGVGRTQHKIRLAPSKRAEIGQPTSPPPGHLYWRQRHMPIPGDRDSEPVAIVTDKDGYFVVGGFVQTLKNDVDMLVAKYDSYGKRLWEYRYNGDGKEMDRLKAMVVGPDGAVYVTGESMGKTGAGNENLSELDITVIKLNPNYKKEVWKDTFRGKSNGLDSPADIGIDSAGNVYVVGRSWQGHARGHGLVVLKYSPSGERVWTYESPGKGRNERAINIVVRDRAVYVAAHSSPIPSSPDETDLLLKLSIEGKEEWRQVSPGGGRSPSSPRVAVDKDDAVYLASQSKPGAIHGAFLESQIILTRFSPDGTQQWHRALPAGAEEENYPIDLKADPRGGVVLSGLSEGKVWHILCASYSSAGGNRYTHKVLINPGANLKPPRIWVDRDGNVALTGSIFTGMSGRTGREYDAVTAFIRADGVMSWSEQYDGPDHLADQGMAVTTEAGKIYSAVQATEGGIREIQILKYSPFPDQLSGH